MSRSVLVTGGNRGIGLAIARRLSAAGDAVTVTSRSGEEIEGLTVARCDVRDAASVDEAFTTRRGRAWPGRGRGGQRRNGQRPAARADERGSLHLGRRHQPDRRLPGGQAGRSADDANAQGPDHLHLLGRRLLGSGGQANYAASKAGLVGMARSLARELGSRNITVNVVAPGFADTDMTAELTPERKKAIVASVPLGPHGVAGRGGRGRAVPGWARRRLHHRRGHPGGRRPWHGPLNTHRKGGHGASRRQADSDHRGPDRLLDRIPRRQGRAGAGRNRGADRVRPDEPGGADREAAARPAARDRARRDQSRAARIAGRAGRRVCQLARRRAARDRQCPADGARRQLPQHALAGRVGGDARLDVLAQGPRDGDAAADEGERRVAGRAGLRRQPGLALL